MKKRLVIIMLIILTANIIFISPIKSSNKGNTQIYTTEHQTDINEFNRCHKRPLKQDELSDELKKKIDEIKKHFESSDIDVSFSYEDIQTGMRIGYNEDEQYFTASVIKSPVVMYIYKMSIDNEIDLNEEITYDPKFYSGGTGSLQYQPFYTKYTIRELIEKTITESDNVAYRMLCSKVPKEDIKNFYHELGATTFWDESNTIWGKISSNDGVLYMKELYDFMEENKDLKQEMLSSYTKASNKLITLNNKEIEIAHKSGWASTSIHDMAIVYDKHPYVLSINTSLGYENFTPFFTKASTLINEFHELYWNQKLDYCYKEAFK